MHISSIDVSPPQTKYKLTRPRHSQGCWSCLLSVTAFTTELNQMFPNEFFIDLCWCTQLLVQAACGRKISSRIGLPQHVLLTVVAAGHRVCQVQPWPCHVELLSLNLQRIKTEKTAIYKIVSNYRIQNIFKFNRYCNILSKSKFSFKAFLNWKFECIV